MNIINKILIILLLGACFLNTFSFVSAADSGSDLEIEYPTLSQYINVPETTKTFLPRYIQYVYNVAVFAGGLIAFLSLLVGGFRFITSVGNPGTMQDARDQIFSGILGMLVIFGSFLILRELNPELTSFALPELISPRRGIVIYNDDDCGSGVGNGTPYAVDLPKETEFMTIGNTRGNLTEDATGKIIKSFFSFPDSKTLTSIAFYKNNNCDGSYEYATSAPQEGDACVRLPNPVDGIRCIELLWRDPGVWLFNTENGNPMKPKKEFAIFKTSQDELPNGLKDNVHSVALVKNSSKEGDYYYGAILYNIAGAGQGWAEVLLPDTKKDITVYNLDGSDETHVSSIIVFRVPSNTDTFNPTDTFTLYREAGKVMPDKDDVLVTPQLKIKWDVADGLTDITESLCQGGANSATFDEAAVDIWTPSSTCSLSHVVGAIKVKGMTWKNEDDKDVDIPGDDTVIPGHDKAEGVTGFYPPSTSRYISLLFKEETKNFSEFVRDNARLSKHAITVHGSYSTLSDLSFDNLLTTLIVVRTK